MVPTPQQVKKPRNILFRIKWKSVGIFLALLLIVFLLIIGFNPIGLDYTGTGDVKIKTWLEPNKVGLSGKSTLWVEVRNYGNNPKNVSLFIDSYDPSVKFLNTETQQVNEAVTLGSGESRKLDFKLTVLANYGGDYGIKVKAKYGTKEEEIEDEVFLSVSKR